VVTERLWQRRSSKCTSKWTAKWMTCASLSLLLTAHLLGQGVVAKAPIPTADAASFANPLLPSGADPWVTLKDGYYYYMHTTGKNLSLWKARDVTDLKRAPHKVIWDPPNSGPYSHDIWAPEIHFLEGKWYVYFAADAGTNRTHRIWVIENPSRDPFSGHWTLKGKVSDATDRWAIDPSVFEDRGRLYMIWSGWEDDKDGLQSIYLARMKNPWTIESPRVRISTPEYPWEKIGDLHPKNPALDPVHVDVNEGPEILRTSFWCIRRAGAGQMLTLWVSWSPGLTAICSILQRGKNPPSQYFSNRPQRVFTPPVTILF
jgi:hypothetical protein